MGLLRWLRRALKTRKRYPYRKIQQVLGDWKPYTGVHGLPGSNVPLAVELPEDAERWGAQPGKMSIDEALFPYWLRVDPALVGFVLSEVRQGRMYRAIDLERKDKPPRRIHEPAPVLKFIQRRILQRLLMEMFPHDAAHGFVRGRSIFTNAAEHTKQRVVVCMDLRDFFPSITFPRVYGLFRQRGFSVATASKLAGLCSFRGVLPQGAPTSPMITNLICRRLDSRLHSLLRKRGGQYTRYADDLTFSGDESILSLLPLIRRIVNEEGFTEAKEKFRIQRSGSRQKVTGLVVNQRVTVPRRVRRLLRAMVHQYGRSGEGDPRLRYMLMGYINFMKPVHPETSQQLARQLGG